MLLLLLQFVNEVHIGHKQKDIMIAEQICTPVQVISFCSSNTAARSPEMKDKKHYKREAKYTETNSAPSYAWTDSLCT